MKAKLGRSFFLLKNASATWLLILVLSAFQIASFFSGALENIQLALGLNRTSFFQGHIHEIFTYAFIHGNWVHLALNLAAILILGSKLEHIIPKRSFKLLGIHSIIAGGLMFLLFSSPNQTLVGASAICFGFLLILLTLSSESKFIPILVTGKSLGITIILANLFLAIIHPQLPTGPLAEIGNRISVWFPDLFKASHACHFGGSLVGWLYGIYLLRPRVTLKTLQKQRAERSSDGSEN